MAGLRPRPGKLLIQSAGVHRGIGYGREKPEPITDYPNDPAQLPDIPWMTWIPDRLPQFKVHTDLGKAKAALGYDTGDVITLDDGTTDRPIRGGVLYKLQNEKWVAVDIVQPGSLKKDNLMFRSPRKWNKAPGITTVISEHPFN
jgi:hypothetical protein